MTTKYWRCRDKGNLTGDSEWSALTEFSSSASPFFDLAMTYNPALYLRFDDTTLPIAVDSSGNELDGAYLNAVILEQPPLVDDGNSIFLSYTTPRQGVDIQHDPSLNSANQTYILWIKALPQNSTFNGVVTKAASSSDPREVVIDLQGDGLVVFGASAGGQNYAVASQDRVDDDFPHMLTWVKVSGASNTIEGYVDGVSIGSVPMPSAGILNTTGIAIGRLGWVSDQTRYYEGILDDLVVINQALTAQEIAALYAAGTQ